MPETGIRTTAAIIATAALAVLAAACGGSRPAARATANSTSGVRYSNCMRSHGVPNWPDPTIDSEGRPGFAISISKDGFDPDSQFGSEQKECGRRTGSPAPRAVSP